MESEGERGVEAVLRLTGRWHWFAILCLGFPRMMVIWSLVSFFFLAPKVSFHCSGCPNSTCSDCEGLPCTSWVYSSVPFTSTIISEWDLVCDRAYLVNLTQVMFMVWVLLGHVFCSYLSDRFGRKPVVISTGLGLGLGGLIASQAQSLPSFVAARSLQALATGGSTASLHTLSMELLTSSTRCSVGMVPHLFVYLGTSLAALFAFLTKDWRNCLLATSLPSLVNILYIWLLTESPRWLVARGRLPKASDIARGIAKFNRITPTALQAEMEELRKETEDLGEEEEPRIWDLVLAPTLRWRSLNLWFSFLVTSACYYGLNQYLTRIGNDVFSNMGISGLFSLPGCLLSIYLLQKIGRRATLFAAYCVVSLSCFALAAAPQEEEGLRGWLGVVGVSGAAVTFITVFLYSSEIFPTRLRNSGAGLGNATSRLGNVIAPYLITLDWEGDKGSALVFAGLSTLCGLLSLLLPETLGQPLPKTLKDAILLPYSQSPIFCRRKKKAVNVSEKELKPLTIST